MEVVFALIATFVDLLAVVGLELSEVTGQLVGAIDLVNL